MTPLGPVPQTVGVRRTLMGWLAAGFAVLSVSVVLSSVVAYHEDARSRPAVVALVHGGPRAVSAAAANLPVLAVVGASFSAGTGAASPTQAWPQVLATSIGWRAVVSADSGAGYLVGGAHSLGPLNRLLTKLDLPHLKPALVIIQSGHNDVGQPCARVQAGVVQLIKRIRAESPTSAIAVLTVFPTGDHPSKIVWDTDSAIVSAARSADPGVYVFDPLVSSWRFPRLPDELHPTPAGHRWIADQLASDLRADGLVHDPARVPAVRRPTA
ncbi:MAG: hypothetical protein JWN03_981 [Nocardia sp.]|nr:hypothetical protein [Nocardia sp.]